MKKLKSPCAGFVEDLIALEGSNYPVEYVYVYIGNLS